MNNIRHLAAVFLLSALAGPQAIIAAPVHDGAHDFDFNVGTWRTHIRSLHQAPGQAATWVALTGTVTIHRIWSHGPGLVEVIKADGATEHIEGVTLYLYNPQSRKWTQTFAGSGEGTLEPSMIGDFTNGRGELIAHDTDKGRSVLDRGVWSDITPNAHRFEIDNSIDGGKTWQPQFIANLTRIS